MRCSCALFSFFVVLLWDIFTPINQRRLWSDKQEKVVPWWLDTAEGYVSSVEHLQEDGGEADVYGYHKYEQLSLLTPILSTKTKEQQQPIDHNW